MDTYRQGDKDHVFYRFAFSGNGQEGLRKLSEFVAIHVPGRREHERNLLENLERAMYEARRDIKRITTPERWNLDKLLGEKYGKKVLRKPRIMVDMDVTSKGNLTVRWLPHPESNDFTFSGWEFQPQAPYRPMNEIFFARGFFSAIQGAGSFAEGKEENPLQKEDNWLRTVRLRIAEVTLECVKDLLDELEEHCEVTLDSRIVTENDEETGLITAWRFENLEAIRERERLASEARYEQAKAGWAAAETRRVEEVQSVIDGAEITYGIPAARLIGLIDAIREHRLDFPTTLSLMEEKYGMKPADPNLNHVGNTRAVRRAMRELGVEPEAISLKKDDVTSIRSRETATPKAATASKNGELSDRLKKRIAAHASREERVSTRTSGKAPDCTRFRL